MLTVAGGIVLGVIFLVLLVIFLPLLVRVVRWATILGIAAIGLLFVYVNNQTFEADRPAEKEAIDKASQRVERVDEQVPATSQDITPTPQWTIDAIDFERQRCSASKGEFYFMADGAPNCRLPNYGLDDANLNVAITE
ncbi:MAG: hypothetical protein JSV45_07710 [Chromatiales bacterium]|nr:MAG: hypothetical protein JSV45_07710 [Chromatiales bacterium]